MTFGWLFFFLCEFSHFFGTFDEPFVPDSPQLQDFVVPNSSQSNEEKFSLAPTFPFSLDEWLDARSRLRVGDEPGPPLRIVCREIVRGVPKLEFVIQSKNDYDDSDCPCDQVDYEYQYLTYSPSRPNCCENRWYSKYQTEQLSEKPAKAIARYERLLSEAMQLRIRTAVTDVQCKQPNIHIAETARFQGYWMFTFIDQLEEKELSCQPTKWDIYNFLPVEAEWFKRIQKVEVESQPPSVFRWRCSICR
jgi:hypothetical protein